MHTWGKGRGKKHSVFTGQTSAAITAAAVFPSGNRKIKSKIEKKHRRVRSGLRGKKKMRWTSAAVFLCAVAVCHGGNILNTIDVTSGIITTAGTASTCSGVGVLALDHFPKDKSFVVSGPGYVS